MIFFISICEVPESGNGYLFSHGTLYNSKSEKLMSDQKFHLGREIQGIFTGEAKCDCANI